MHQSSPSIRPFLSLGPDPWQGPQGTQSTESPASRRPPLSRLLEDASAKLRAGDAAGVLALARDNAAKAGLDEESEGDMACLAGLAALRLNRPEEARDWFAAAANALSEPDLDIQMAMAGCALANGDLEDAEAGFRAVLAEAPHATAAAVGLAETLTQRGEPDAALSAWRYAVGAVMAANPASCEPWMRGLPAEVGLSPVLTVVQAMLTSPVRDLCTPLIQWLRAVAPNHPDVQKAWQALQAPTDGVPQGASMPSIAPALDQEGATLAADTPAAMELAPPDSAPPDSVPSDSARSGVVSPPPIQGAPFLRAAAPSSAPSSAPPSTSLSPVLSAVLSVTAQRPATEGSADHAPTHDAPIGDPDGTVSQNRAEDAPVQTEADLASDDIVTRWPPALESGPADSEDEVLADIDGVLADTEEPAAIRALQAYWDNHPAVAASLAQEAIDQDPADPDGWLTLGLAQEALGRDDAAITAYMGAVLRAPDDPAGHQGLARILDHRNLVDAAIDRWWRAVGVAPHGEEEHRGLAGALLKRGDTAEGWAVYGKGGLAIDRPPLGESLDAPWGGTDHPIWDGESLEGRRLLVRHEGMNLTDVLLFLRLLPAVERAAGGALLLEVAPALVMPCSRAMPTVTVIAASDPPHPETKAADIAARVSLHDVPGLLGDGDPANLVEADPTLEGDPDAVDVLADRIRATAPDALWVGVSWRSGSFGDDTLPGSTPQVPDWSDWLELFLAPGVRFVSVQPGSHAVRDMNRLRAVHGVDLRPDPAWTLPSDLGMSIDPALQGGAHTPADPAHEGVREATLTPLITLLGALDVVVTVDNTVAHLTGALGLPGIVLLPFSAQWPWGLSGTVTPWYPSLRLARQSAPGAWESPMERVAHALARFRVR